MGGEGETRSPRRRVGWLVGCAVGAHDRGLAGDGGVGVSSRS